MSDIVFTPFSPEQDSTPDKIPQLPYEQFYIDYGVYIPAAIVDIWGDIDEDSAQTAIQSVQIIKQYHAKCSKYPTLRVSINTFGGSWYAGIALYQAIKSYPGEVHTYVQSAAMSMGSILLQAGDKRFAYKHSTIMVHDGEDHLQGNRNDVKGWAKHAEKMWSQMYDIYAEKSGKKASYWKRKCSSDYILDADKALKEGLIDEVID